MIMTEPQLLFVYGNAAAGRDNDFNTWYDQHIREMTGVAGVHSGQRFAALDSEFAKAFPLPPAPYLSRYEFEGDPDAMWAGVVAGIKSGAVTMSDSVEPSAVLMQVWAPHKGRIDNESSTPRDERGFYFVFGNALEGKDEVYNDWYDNTHLPEVLAVPGVLSAQRYTLAEPECTKRTPVTHRYLAAYEFEGSADAIMTVMREKSASGEMNMHPSLDLQTVRMSFWNPLTPKVTA
jgi:hypothetical protein